MRSNLYDAYEIIIYAQDEADYISLPQTTTVIQNAFEEDPSSGTSNAVILSPGTSLSTTVSSDSDAVICGTSGPNLVNIESAARAQLINFGGNNMINIESDSTLFAVFRSGAVVTFEGTDGTLVTMPATQMSQTILFSYGSWALKIEFGEVLLGKQLIGTTSAPVTGI